MKEQSASIDWLVGGGQMGELIRSMDWSKTPLGSIESWPQSLRTSVSILLNSRYPMFIFWGEELIKIYNDAYRPVLGTTKHPGALGQPARKIWSEIWDDIGPLVNQVITERKATWDDNLLLFMYRNGYVEETYFTFSYSPIQDESGGVGGLFCACTETTQQVLGERRLRTLRDLATGAGEAKTVETACQIAMKTLGNNPADIPFALLYLLDRQGRQADLVGYTNLEPDTPASPSCISLTDLTQASVWSLEKVMQTAQPERIDDVIERFGLLPVGLWDDAPHTALVIPVASPGQERPAALLVVGISPRRALDDDYQGFLQLVAGQMASAIADARAYEVERQRAEALAEIDRAKTVFFSNVSHEFRTPLTLMLAPTEDALADTENPLPPIQRDRVETVYRNSLRLLKLVNTLLDFSRIEAGRIQAVYEPTDLAALTTGLASTFRSLVERAGLTFVVECPPLADEIYVDQELWEKIVLNLLSNAFKFTFSGTIAVRLTQVGEQVELAISDTGIGIPAAVLPHLFERFHRVKGAQGRSFEGSGIGLSLVQELVKLHGGHITVNSTVGQGSCFTVSIPTGTAHLPPDRIRPIRSTASIATGATAYVEEALRWLPERSFETSPLTSKAFTGTSLHIDLLSTSNQPSAHILIVDDNADMRDYLKRLLSQRYEVTAVEDGIAALSSIANSMPDLVLTDVMLPRLDGFGLLQHLRGDRQTSELPIILLSARAGEESRIEGLEAGADDYLIKPFSNRELLARVEACLKLAQIRQQTARQEKALRLAAEQAQQKAEAAQTRFTDLLESMSDAFVELDTDWRIVQLNSAAVRINGGKPISQLLGKICWEEWPAAVGSELEHQYRRAVLEQVPVHFEHHYLAAPMFDVWLEIHVYPSQTGLAIFYQDITDRKRLEIELRERERLFSTLADASPVAIFRFDTANNCVYVNDHWTKLTGRSIEAAFGQGWQEALHPEDRDRIGQAWQVWCQSSQPRGRYQNEGRCLHPDGRVVWFYVQALAETDADGETVGYIGVLTDITALKQTEAALQVSRNQLQQQLAEIETIYQSAPIGLNVLDTDLRFIRINQQLAEINGLPVEAHLGRSVREVLPDLADTAEQLLRTVLATGEPLLNVEITGETPAQPGVQRIWLEHFLPLKDGDRVIGISTVCEEITERKRLEAERHQTELELRRAKEELEQRVAERTAELQQRNAELQQSESTLRSFFNSGAMPMGIVELHHNDILHISDNWAAAEFFGTVPEAMRGRYSSSLGVPQGTIEKWIGYYRQSEQLQAPVRFEYLHEIPTGPRWLSGSVCPIAASPSGYPRFSYIVEDVTDRKQAEATLAYREEQLRLTLEFNHIGTWDWDVKTGDVLWNDNHFRLLGLDPESTSARYQLWRNSIHPDDVARVEQGLTDALTWHTDYETDYRVIYPDGTLHWVVGKGRGIYNEAGEPVRMLGIILDVSDRKRIEAALQSSEARYRAIVQDQVEFIIRFAPDTMILFANDAYCRYFGVELNDILGKSFKSTVYEADWESIVQSIQAMNAESPTLTVENRVIDRNGEIRWTQWVCRMLFNPEGQILEFQAVGRDITELRQAEQALRRSEERLQLALEASGDGIWDWNIVTNEIYYSPQYFQMLGYEANEFPHTVETWYQLVHPDDMVWVNELLERHFQDSSVRYEFDYRLRTKADQWKWIADYGKVVARDEQGKPLRMIGTHRDVSDRKQAEAALKQSELRFRGIFDQMFQFIGLLSPDGILLEANQTALEFAGLSRADVIGTYFWDVIWWQLSTETQEQLKRAIAQAAQGEFIRYQVDVQGANQQVITIDFSLRPIVDEAGQVVMLIPEGRDITELKRAEQMLELQAVITRNMAEGICLVRTDNGIIVYANPKFEQMFGYDFGELNGRHVSIINYASDTGAAQAVNLSIREAVLQSGESTYEVHNVKKDGTPFWCSATTSVFKHPDYGDVLVAVQQDITDRKQAESKIAASLKEKEILLKEIHHRVKNNLSIVSGLLQMQARRTQNAQADAILRDSQNRIASIALVHEKLYRAEDLANIDFAQYIQDLTVYLFDSYNINSSQVKLKVQVEKVNIDVETAIPCGLIVNELVSNALKHAFPADLASGAAPQRTGEIQVKLEQAIASPTEVGATHSYILTVRDNGVGLPTDFNPETTKTLGLTLVRGLVSQIRGSMEIDGNQGTEFRVAFVGKNV